MLNKEKLGMTGRNSTQRTHIRTDNLNTVFTKETHLQDQQDQKISDNNTGWRGFQAGLRQFSVWALDVDGDWRGTMQWKAGQC